MHAGRIADGAGTCFGSAHSLSILDAKPSRWLRRGNGISSLCRRCYECRECRDCTARQQVDADVMTAARLGTWQVTCSGAWCPNQNHAADAKECWIATLFIVSSIRNCRSAGLAAASQTEAPFLLTCKQRPSDIGRRHIIRRQHPDSQQAAEPLIVQAAGSSWQNGLLLIRRHEMPPAPAKRQQRLSCSSILPPQLQGHLAADRLHGCPRPAPGRRSPSSPRRGICPHSQSIQQR